MASDDMKKMLILIESCSCESNKEDTDEVTEGGTPISSLTHRYLDDPNHPDFKSGSNTEPEKSKTLQDIIKNNDFNGLQIWAMDNKNNPLLKGASAAADAAGNSIKQELGLAGKLPYEIPASVMMDKINPARRKAMFDYLKAHATEGEEVDEMFFYPDTRSREEKNRAANEPQDILGRRPVQGIAKYGKEYKAMKKGTSAQDAADRERYGLGGPKGPLPESFEAFVESMREMAGGQLDELGDTFMGRMKLRALARRADKTDPRQDVAKRFNDSDVIGAFNAQYRDSEERLSNVANAARERIANKGTDTAAIQQRNAQADADQAHSDTSHMQWGRDRLNIDDPDYVKARFAKVAPIRPGQYGVSQRNTFRGDVPKPVKENELTQEDAEFQSFMETLNYVMRKK